MTILDTSLNGDIHFPVRVTCAIGAFIAVGALVYLGVPGQPTTEPEAVVAALDCTASAEICLELWLNENLTDVQQTIGTLAPVAD